jgi:hypothetical protein
VRLTMASDFAGRQSHECHDAAQVMTGQQPGDKIGNPTEYGSAGAQQSVPRYGNAPSLGTMQGAPVQVCPSPSPDCHRPV